MTDTEMCQRALALAMDLAPTGREQDGFSRLAQEIPDPTERLDALLGAILDGFRYGNWPYAEVTVAEHEVDCRARGHHNWDREAPSIWTAEGTAYFTGLTESVTATCADCGLTRTDMPGGGRSYRRAE